MLRCFKIIGFMLMMLGLFGSSAQASIWGGFDFPKNISTNGHLIDNVIVYIDKVLVIFFGIVVAAMTFFIFRYRSRPGHQAVYETGNKRVYVIMTILMGALVFFSIDAVVEHMAFRDLKEAFWNFPTGKNVLKVQIMPQQFAWNIRYAGADGEFATADDIIAPLSQMHVPVNTPVVAQMSSFDVVHAFYVPELRFKVDAVPGMVTTFWFQAKETGKFEIACSALCGNGHYKMRGNLTVESKEEFENWLKAQAPVQGGEEDLWGESSSSTNGVPKDWGWKWQSKN